MTKERELLSMVSGNRDALKQEMFERLVHEEGDGWKAIADRLAPRRDHLRVVPTTSTSDSEEPCD